MLPQHFVQFHAMTGGSVPRIAMIVNDDRSAIVQGREEVVFRVIYGTVLALIK